MSEADVRAVFAEVLGLDEPIDWAAVRYGEVASWDSLVHLGLVAALESAFGIRFTDDDILALGGVDDAVRIVDARRAGGPS